MGSSSTSPLLHPIIHNGLKIYGETKEERERVLMYLNGDLLEVNNEIRVYD